MTADSLAARTREAARAHPFLVATLRAGACNYAAAARFLDVDGDPEAVATALRRYADELPAYAVREGDPRVTMESGLGAVDLDGSVPDGTADGDAPPPLLCVGGTGFVPDAGTLTGLLATGDVDPRALAWAVERLDAAEVEVAAAGVAGDALLVVVERRAAPRALRALEDALAAVPTGLAD
ncbi:MAG: hypothetical protein ABEJ42_05145 [Halobacteriaceae archaeon]